MRNVCLPLAVVVLFCPGAVVPAQAQTETAKYPQTITNSIGMKLVRIEPGEFWMGTAMPSNELAELFKREGTSTTAFATEYPRHKVRITKPFFMGQYEVTVGQFRRFVTETNYVTEGERNGKGGEGWNEVTKDIETTPRYTWQVPGWTPYDDTHPVVNVTWSDAQRFCRWLSTKDRRPYRLPTEAEWEYACRAGTETLYWNGNDPENLPQIANVRDLLGVEKVPVGQAPMIKTHDGYAFTAPVGSYPANPWGLHDMHGNVAEWTADVFTDLSAYRKQASTAVVENPLVNSGDVTRITRGGHFMKITRDSRSAFREKRDPNRPLAAIGFRVVAVADPEFTKP